MEDTENTGDENLIVVSVSGRQSESLENCTVQLPFKMS